MGHSVLNPIIFPYVFTVDHCWRSPQPRIQHVCSLLCS